MKFTLMRVLDSLAGVLKKGYPEYPVYIEPGIQETEVPCFFLFLMPSEISGETGGRYLRDLGIDIVLCSSGISRMETGGCFLWRNIWTGHWTVFLIRTGAGIRL